jgi:hypothetical protein
MADQFIKNIDGVAEYQNNHLTCWAAVALTAYRAKFGISGKGASVASLLGGEGGGEFLDIFDFCAEIEVERANSVDGDIAKAIDAVRTRDPRFRNVVHGLGSGRAEAFFKTFLKMKGIAITDSKICKSTELSTQDKIGMKGFIKKNAPIVIFTKNAGGGGGHLRLIHGWWDGGDVNSPQICLWDPEAPLNAEEKGTADAMTPAKRGGLAKSRLLWPHFVDQVVKRLATPEVYYFE